MVIFCQNLKVSIKLFQVKLRAVCLATLHLLTTLNTGLWISQTLFWIGNELNPTQLSDVFFSTAT